jgi:predicted phage terminase large subunit-like protein
MTVINRDLNRLMDQERLSERRRAAEEEYRDLTNDQISYLRKRAKNDLFFLASGPLEYDRLDVNLHGSVCNWLEKTRDHQHRLLLLPRDHYKSTVGTISESVQMALPNDAGVQQHPWCLGPDIKMLIAHENRESAARFLYEITAAFMKKPLMLALFPECIPSKPAQRINKWELELPRDSHHKEPTFDTIGTGGAAQGRHYNWIKLDDIIGDEARDSETVMKRAIMWFDNINSLLTRLIVDGWDLIGTHWSYGDVYTHAKRQYGIDREHSIQIEDDPKVPHGELVTYIRGAEEYGVPIFPAEFPADKLRVIKKNRLVWAAQYANNPRDSELTEFHPSWLRFYNVSGHDLVIFEGDSSRRVHIWDLDRVILCDPSVGETSQADESGLIVTGTDRENNIYILETVKKHLRPPEFIDMVLRLHQKWNPRLVSIEKVIFSATYKYWLQERAKDLKIYPSFYDYKPGGKRSKTARIRGLTNYFAAGQVYILDGMYDFREEYEAFPLGTSEHLLDAMAQGPEVWTAGLSERQWDDYRAAEEAILAERDIVTGY